MARVAVLSDAHLLMQAKRFPDESDKSPGDKQAATVTKAWQKTVAFNDVRCKVPIRKDLNGKIDVVDFSTVTAYEMKVFARNPHHEFHRDISKVPIYI